MRARNIKPGFFSNEDLAEMLPEGRLLFIGLWCLADREGKLEDRPKRIKGELFRFDDIPVERLDSLLEQLSSLGLIIRYEVTGSKYIKIPKFLKHQRPHHNEKPSTIPEPLSTKVESTCHQGNKQEQPKDKALRPDSLNPDSLNNKSGILNPDSQIKDLSAENPPTTPIVRFSVDDLAILWNEKRPPELSAVNLPLKRPAKDMTKIKDALKRNPEREWWERVVLRLHQSPHCRGNNDRGWKASFDFMVTHAEVILDGKYDGGGRVATQPGIVDWFHEGGGEHG
jgi:hypothetical protein